MQVFKIKDGYAYCHSYTFSQAYYAFVDQIHSLPCRNVSVDVVHALLGAPGSHHAVILPAIYVAYHTYTVDESGHPTVHQSFPLKHQCIFSFHFHHRSDILHPYWIHEQR